MLVLFLVLVLFGFTRQLDYGRDSGAAAVSGQANI
jgi:hypothetical protein